MRCIWQTLPIATLLVVSVPLSAQEARREQGKLRRASNKAEAATISRMMTRAWQKRVDASVEKGLDWLARKQNSKGFWTGLVGHKQGSGYMQLRPIEEQLRAGTGHLGVTALCGMAFLAGGHLPNRGRYGRQVQKTVDAVLSCIQDNGVITVAGSRMYSHAFATLFLAEVYGMSRDKGIKKGLERATHIIVDCQNAVGAWRYNPFSKAADLSVTVCQLQALRAAKNIGIQIPRSTIDRAVAYVKKSRINSGHAKGLYYYKIYGRGSYQRPHRYAINAAALTSLVSAGVYDRELIEPALDFLASELGSLSYHWPDHFYFWYGNYYACQAFFHAEGLLRSDCFRRYYATMRDHLLANQRRDGRWRNATGPGDAFGTAVACIILQIPKQYLPIFQR